jgi:hypothetical protein
MGRQSLVGQIGPVSAAQVDDFYAIFADLNSAVVFGDMRVIKHHIAVDRSTYDNRVLNAQWQAAWYGLGTDDFQRRSDLCHIDTRVSSRSLTRWRRWHLLQLPARLKCQSEGPKRYFNITFPLAESI